MKVYLLIHEVYLYWNNEYLVEIKSFKDEQSAINYLSFVKQEILNELMREKDVETVNELMNVIGDKIISFDNCDDYFYLELEEDGYDILYIEEQDVMEFNL